MASKKEKKKKKTKKKRHLLGPKEFIFNFVSLVFALVVLLYFGGRCFYYYSLQSQNKKAMALTLNGTILENNPIAKDGDGFYKSADGYIFKGKVENNYVWFANRMFRVLSISDDNTVKLVSNDLVSMFMWGESESYIDSNLRIWLTKTDEAKSGVYLNTIPNTKKYISKTEYTVDTLKDGKIKEGKDKYSDSVVSLTLNDYLLSGGKDGFLNNGKLYFLLGFTNDKDRIYVEEDGSINGCDKLDAYGIRSVITLKKNLTISSGDGTVSNPYVVDLGKDNNYVDSYVKLGDDIWKVSSNENGILKMYLNGYIKYGEQDYFRNYSNVNSVFDYNDNSNIANYLLYNYYQNLPYKDYIVSSKYPSGEISAETGYNFANIYASTFDGTISLLNLFDYVSNNELTDFYRNNTTSQVGDIQYVTFSNGLVEETNIGESKHIVPVISINSSNIKGGNGKLDNPYVVG